MKTQSNGIQAIGAIGLDPSLSPQGLGDSMRHRRQWAWVGVVHSFLLALAALAVLGMGVAQAAPVSITVVSARSEPLAFDGSGVAKGASVDTYKYIINIDNTGQTTQRSPAPGTGCSPQDAGYPKDCLWTSIAGTQGHAPVYMQGDQDDFAAKTQEIPNGRYLISVLADGYKLDGRHFTVSGSTVTWEGKAATDPTTEVKVELQPTPLPDAQIQAAVFEDISPVNSAPDLPAEHGLAGFQGHILDYLGEVTTDVYGGPLCETGRCLSACYVVNNGQDVGVVQPTDAAGRCPSDNVPAQMSQCPNGTAPYVLSVNSSGDFNTFQCYGGATPSLVATPAGAAIEGKVKIPNLGPNRYTLSVTPPDGSGWIQTTTLEGNHDWDAWVMEGATGLDTEFLAGGEPFPAIIFGYIPVPGTPSAVGSALPAALTGNGSITGVVEGVKIYVPTTGGVAGLPGEIWGGLQGAKLDKPIEYPWVTLTNLGNGDTVVWAGKGDVNGRFEIPNVPAGTYTLTWWDEPQNTILDLVNVTVGAGEHVDMGILPLAGWWTFFDGYVFNDTNRNGIKDEGEPGLPGYTLTMRKRENSLMDRGTTVATTDADGYYKFEAGYPMTQWLVMEAYDDLHYTTGVTYQADNQPSPTTILGAGVDVSVHPIIGLSGHMDWGKHVYDASGTNGVDPQNGGIVGTVSYDTTRNELDPRYAAVEDWQPSIPDLLVKLYEPEKAPLGCTRLDVTGSNAGVATCDPTGRYALDSDKSIKKGQLLNTYITETWKRPSGCVARGLDGTPLVHGADEQVLPTDNAAECLEAPLMGVQFWGGDPTNGSMPGVEVNGNYGFGDGCFAPNVLDTSNASLGPVCRDGAGTDVGFAALPGGRDYLVQVDLNSQLDAKGRPIYKVTREEDINIGNGDAFVPAVPPSACAGALHTVDSSGNANFPGGAGTSPYEGQNRPLCDTKLVNLLNGKSIAPAFNIYTDVPIPGRHWFIIIDDLNFSSNPKSVTYGEKAGMPFVPVGIYDYTDRLIKTVESDYNGLADVLLPSTNRINCPTPSGVCGNLYRYVGNDPGVPGRLNPNYNPLFRTIAAEFEVLPGLIVPADLAPTQVGVTVQLPGGQTTSPVQCKLDDATPELYAVNKPLLRSTDTGNARQITISGKAFGATRGSGSVTLDGGTTGVTVNSWSDKAITVTLANAGTIQAGPHQLAVTSGNGQSTVNGLTVHVLSGPGTLGSAPADYNPGVFEVGPGKTYVPAETLPATADHAIQRALNDAANFVGGTTNGSTRGALVVVYPNNPSVNPRQNPRGAYYENLIISAKVKLQGVGPGSPDGSVRGSIIDGAAFAGDSPVATDWYTTIEGLQTVDADGNVTSSWAGNQTIYDGAVISLYLPQPTNNANSTASRKAFPTTFNARTAPSIDGFDLRGGNQQGFPGNINAIGGLPTGQPGGLITQGGAIFANAWANNLQITNNVVQNNGGAYGTIRIGTPDLPAPDTDNHNYGVNIAYNRVITNAGTNQAGGIGLFGGSRNYQIARNDICGNFSSEYGGGISAIGMNYNPQAAFNANSNFGGRITGNRIYFNRSFDEGGGIMIAGALPATTTTLSPGSGPVEISGNLIQANLSNDDGGGLRFLMAGNFPMNVFNNFIVNNISAHEGGGVSLNDTPDVRFYNNTVMKNLTTATAVTSSGAPAPAGLSTSRNSTLLQANLPNTAPLSSTPLLFNNIFWDNRAGTRSVRSVTGIGAAGDATAIDYWDLGDADAVVSLTPTNSVIQQNAAQHLYTTSATNVATDPVVKSPYDVGVTFNTWRNNPAFLGAIMISADLPPNLMGDYHLAAGTTGQAASTAAINRGATSKSGVNAPGTDIDGQGRTGLPDAGADEFVGIPAPFPGISPASLGFGNAFLGTTTAAQTLTLSNTGSAALNITSITVTAPFARQGGTCNATLNVNATCTITVVFTPTTVGLATGTVTIAGNGTQSGPITAVQVPLTGTGLAIPTRPTLAVLDPFTRADANTLGAGWSQLVLANASGIRVNANQASCSGVLCLLGANAYWNAAPFGTTQAAAFTFANTTVNNAALYLKASGTFNTGSGVYPTAIRVRYSTNNGGQVIVETTTNGTTFNTAGTLAGTFANGDTLTAQADATGQVYVWKTSGAATTFLGAATVPTTGNNAFTTGTGRIGISLPSGGRVDNFAGGSL